MGEFWYCCHCRDWPQDFELDSTLFFFYLHRKFLFLISLVCAFMFQVTNKRKKRTELRTIETRWEFVEEALRCKSASKRTLRWEIIKDTILFSTSNVWSDNKWNDMWEFFVVEFLNLFISWIFFKLVVSSCFISCLLIK